MSGDQNQNNQEQSLPPVPAPNELEQKLAEAEKKRDEYLAGWQRAKADYLNYKKEELSRLAEVGKYASEELMREFIVVVDNYELAIAAMEKGKAAPTPPEGGSESRPSGVGIEKGVYLIKAQLEDILKKRGVERLSAKPGDAFDPNFMEALAEVDAPTGGAPPGSVADEIEAGYKLHEKILRPIRVRLVKS